MSKITKEEYKQELNNKNKLNRRLEKEVKNYIETQYTLQYGESFTSKVEKVYIQNIDKEYIQYSYRLNDDSREWFNIPTEFIFNRDKWKKKFLKDTADKIKENEHNQLAYAITLNIYKADNEVIEEIKLILEKHLGSKKV